MKIAILGTKGIPNNYGGFEQFAEYLSISLVERGHQVTVYNPSFHSFEGDKFKGVHIEKVFSPEKLIGGAANFIYDHLCLKHALRKDFDIIYEAGYHSVAFSYKLLGIQKIKYPVILTNMDGLEWMRSKWSKPVQDLILKLEAIAVKHSPYLISDNEGIRKYYLERFNRDSFYIPYGADAVDEFDINFLTKHNISVNNYFILIARMEPENNVELILESYADSNHKSPFIAVGNHHNEFGRKMFKKYSSKVTFTGSIYNKKELDALRYYATSYFHGHSVGGTNPSLLEAMACRSFILAHSNDFNRGVLDDDAIYFSTKEELIGQFRVIEDLAEKNSETFKRRNLEKIERLYNWNVITSQHEDLFRSLLANSQSSSR